MTTRTIIAALALLCSLGCRDRQEPDVTKVEIAAEHVEQICQGTTAHAQAELARVEAELELGPASEVIEVVVVEPERIAEHCPAGKKICVHQPPRRVFISAEVFDAGLTRELIRARMTQIDAGSTKPIFFEGLASALTRPTCTPHAGWNLPSAGSLLSRTLGTSFEPEHLFLAGTLVRWMLDTHGPAVVLEFMDSVNRNASPDVVRLAYLERFGSSLDADLFAHWPAPGERLSPERAGCIGEEPPRDPVSGRIHLSAEFDCDSPRVRTDFRDPGRAFVEWVLTIDEDNKGRYRLGDELPEGVDLWIEHCDCVTSYWTEQLPLPAGPSGPFDPDDGALLWPGTYRLRAYAPLGTTLDYDLLTPCDFEAQNCPAGQQCALSRECIDEVPDPAQLGEACSPNIAESESLLACDVGLVCVGPTGQPGVCMRYCGDTIVDASCPADQTCAYVDVCGALCDPLAQDCDSQESCRPDFETGAGACLPSGGLGPLETCVTLDLACGPGLVCETHDSVPGCSNPDPDVWLDFTGCCTPICDPASPDPNCPPELPTCAANPGETLGMCRP